MITVNFCGRAYDFLEYSGLDDALYDGADRIRDTKDPDSIIYSDETLDYQIESTDE